MIRKFYFLDTTLKFGAKAFKLIMAHKNLETSYILLPYEPAKYEHSGAVGPDDLLFGLHMWKRAVLTCRQAGFRRIFLVSDDGLETMNLNHMEGGGALADIEFISRENAAVMANEDESALILDWNTVLQPGLLKKLNSGESDGTTKILLDRNDKPVGLAFMDGAAVRKFFAGSAGHELSAAEWAKNGEEGNGATGISPSDTADQFYGSVTNRSELRLAEKGLLMGTRHRPHYFMDTHFHSIFSTMISRWLLYTPLTANQVTLMGLPIALASFWLFSRGDYWSGLLAGLLLVFSAIWDCCDGEIARLKFQQTDHGEALDLAVDNITNVATFTGLALGYSKLVGQPLAFGLTFILLVAGFLIFMAVYFPRSQGKAGRFTGTFLDPLVYILVTRDYVYVVLLFCLLGKAGEFLWLAAIGSSLLALILWTGRALISPEGKTRTASA